MERPPFHKAAIELTPELANELKDWWLHIQIVSLSRDKAAKSVRRSHVHSEV
jgi:hypothetical protein